ncbi:MAG TPA: NAD(P)/FAD-dependent oxidoreductase [Candidatus Dormibacteraeota bacterium]|nr:NAD(P)/FAD-dependent oxidoreductase [Candidatus Dormibacteraeota bacterium]
MHDVVVAGGGPAGLSAARAAAEAGASVLVVERESAFGIPTRTSGGSFIAPLRRLGIAEHLWTPIRDVVFFGPTAEARFHYDDPPVCVLDVRALYQWLAERAAAAGAELALRSTVVGVEERSDRVVLRVRGQGGERAIEARWAVDATGTAAVLSRAVGMHPPFLRRGVGAELDLAAPEFPVETCVLAMGEWLAPSGYAWAFPYRPGRVRLGVGVMRPDTDIDPRALLQAARDLPGLRGWLAGAQPIEVHAGVIPADPLRTTVVRGRIVCAGDSASQASTLVGEGIRFALGAGAAAGAAVGAAGRGGGPEAVRAYERDWSRRHRRDFAVAYRISRVLARFDDAGWDRAVATLARTPPWFAVRALGSEFRAGTVMRLAATHPRLAVSFLRAAA